MGIFNTNDPLRRIDWNTDDVVSWIRSWFDKNGPESKAVIGISGGKDSTVVAALCVRALGKDRVYGVIMPNYVQNDISDAVEVCEFLDIEYKIIDISKPYNSIINSMPCKASEQTKINLPARLRMSTLYAVAQSMNGRVSRNCNLSEINLGYFTRWGDECGDFAPLARMFVSDVLRIGEELNIPHHLLYKTPIDGLKRNEEGKYITDEESLGFTYKELEDYMFLGEVAETSKELIRNRILSSEFKRNRFGSSVSTGFFKEVPYEI